MGPDIYSLNPMKFEEADRQLAGLNPLESAHCPYHQRAHNQRYHLDPEPKMVCCHGGRLSWECQPDCEIGG